MQTETAQTNLVGDITNEMIKKIAIPGEMPKRDPFERNHRYDFNVERILEGDQFENTVLINEPDKGQKITIKDVMSMYVRQGTEEVLKDVGEMKLIPNNQGKRGKDAVIEAGKFPVAFTISEVKAYVGATPAYLTEGNDPELKQKMYKAKELPTDGEVIPFLIRRPKAVDVEDPKNWRLIEKHLVELHWE